MKKYKNKKSKSFYKLLRKLGWRKLVVVAVIAVLLVSAAVFALVNNSNDVPLDSTKDTGSARQESPTPTPASGTSRGQSATSAGSGGSISRNSTLTPISTPTPASTPQPTPEPITAYVAFFADTQSDTDEDEARTQTVMGYILSKGANPVFHAGDLLEDGTQDSLDRFNRACFALCGARTFYAAQGNNERDFSLYFDNFSFPNNERWYSVNIGNLHMVVLDVAFSSVAAGSAQYNWLASDLQSSESQNRITGVIFHHPPYGSGGDTKGLISTIVPLFRNYGVDFVISGHEHAYQKTEVDGVDYLITSGQTAIGYMTAEVYSSYATIRYYNSGNGLADTTTISAR